MNIVFLQLVDKPVSKAQGNERGEMGSKNPPPAY